jgi:hypothetical protein
MINQTLVLSSMYSGKPRNFLNEIQSIHCFLSAKSERQFYSCKNSTFNIIINSDSDLLQDTVLLKYIDSKMIQKKIPIN